MNYADRTKKYIELSQQHYDKVNENTIDTINKVVDLWMDLKIEHIRQTYKEYSRHLTVYQLVFAAVNGLEPIKERVIAAGYEFEHIDGTIIIFCKEIYLMCLASQFKNGEQLVHHNLTPLAKYYMCAHEELNRAINLVSDNSVLPHRQILALQNKLIKLGSALLTDKNNEVTALAIEKLSKALEFIDDQSDSAVPQS